MKSSGRPQQLPPWAACIRGAATEKSLSPVCRHVCGTIFLLACFSTSKFIRHSWFSRSFFHPSFVLEQRWGKCLSDTRFCRPDVLLINSVRALEGSPHHDYDCCCCCYYYYGDGDDDYDYDYTTAVLLHLFNGLFPGQPGQAGTRKVNQSGFK